MSMEFYDRRTPVSRKERECEMCGQKIMLGERYSYESGKYNGDFFTRELHLDCLSALEKYWEEVDTEFCWDAVSDWWQETRCSDCKHYYPPCDPTCKAARKGGFYKCEDYKNGKCTAEEPCDEMTRVCWCDKFEES